MDETDSETASTPSTPEILFDADHLSPPSPLVLDSTRDADDSASVLDDDGLKSRFVGQWSHVRSEHYDEFLEHAVGMTSTLLRRLASRIHPTPCFSIEDGSLRVVTVCLGAKPVREIVEPGERALHEPNLRALYTVTGRWEGSAFVATRQSDVVNHGRPIEQKRYIDARTGHLFIEEDWGGEHPFVAEYRRVAA